MQSFSDSIEIRGEKKKSLFVETKSTIKSTFLFEKEEEYYSHIKNENRKNEFLQLRDLRNKTIGKVEIDYTSEGMPFLVDSSDFISISHSTNFIGLIKAPFKIGLDLEEIHERIAKVKNRFLNTEELIMMTDSLISLTIAWTLKEALFKLNNRTGIDFKTELLIEEKTESGFNCKMLDNDGWRQVKLKVIQKENLIISYNFEPSQLL